MIVSDFFDKEVYKVSAELILATYNSMVRANTFEKRAAIGTQGTVKEDEENDNLVIKSQKIGGLAYDLDNEMEILQALKGTGIAPILDENETSYSYPQSIVMEKINNGANLAEWTESYFNGQVATDVYKIVMASAGKALNQFWELGYCQNDTKPQNIVFGIDETEESLIIHPRIIDHPSTFHEDNREAFAEKHGLIVEETGTPEDDMEYFMFMLSEIEKMYPDRATDETYQSIIAAFQEHATMSL